MEQFQQHISVLTPTTVARALSAIENKEDATFFIGRATCPYCRKFAKTLYDVVNETNAPVYFINSEEPSQLDELAAFRKTYNIPTVPGFMHVHFGDVTVRCDSSMTHQEVKEFMHA